MSIRFCHDCCHTFVEHVDTPADEDVCPFCEGGNWDEYDEDAEDADPLSYVEDWEMN
jgi:hypothetical protein